MMGVLFGACAAVFAFSTAVFVGCCWIAAKAESTSELGSVAYGMLALPVAIASGVTGVLLWWFS